MTQAAQPEPAQSEPAQSEPAENNPAKPVGPYTPVVRAGDWIIVSGQLGLKDGKLVEGVHNQTRQAIENLKGHLESMGATLENVAKTLVFLQHMSDFGPMNDEYMAGFGDHRPARSTIGVAGLPLGGLVEIEAWAYVG